MNRALNERVYLLCTGRPFVHCAVMEEVCQHRNPRLLLSEPNMNAWRVSHDSGANRRPHAITRLSTAALPVNRLSPQRYNRSAPARATGPQRVSTVPCHPHGDLSPFPSDPLLPPPPPPPSAERGYSPHHIRLTAKAIPARPLGIADIGRPRHAPYESEARVAMLQL